MSRKEQDIKEHAKNLVDYMTKFLRTRFNSPHFNLGKCIISTNKKRKRSWGGVRVYDGRFKGYINLSLHPFVRNKSTYHFVEYNQYADRQDIGTVEGSWRKCVTALVAHEMAHAFTMLNNDVCVHGSFKATATDEEGHGAQWQYVYCTLREHFHI